MNKLPEKWYVEVTNENNGILNKFKLSKEKAEILHYNYVCYEGFGWLNLTTGLENYTKITTEQFKKFILKENMEQKEVKIQIPEGYEIDESKSTFTNIVFKLKEKKLPKSWEELGEVRGYYVRENSAISHSHTLTYSENRNIWPTKEYAEASIALTQLLQLRQVYNDGWEPDWENDNKSKFCIRYYMNESFADECNRTRGVLSFKSEKLAIEFLVNFKDLIEIAKPLL